LLFNQNQALIHELQNKDDWSKIARLFIDAAKRLEISGASAVLFCANTPHKIFEEVESQISIPIIHIADATASKILQKGLKKVCFIGTKFSMEEEFLKDRFSKSGVEVIAPKDQKIIEELHRIIQEELTFGKIIMNSKKFVIKSIETMIADGAEGVVLGCTEFPLMIKDEDLHNPIFNTTEIHSQSAFKYIVEDEKKH
jgi:aspartate racemase